MLPSVHLGEGDPKLVPALNSVGEIIEQRLPLPKFVYPLQDTHLPRYVPIGQEILERREIQLSRERWVGHQRLQLRCEHESTREMGKKQWLLPRPIPSQKHALSNPVIEPKGKHAVQLRKTINSPGTIGR